MKIKVGDAELEAVMGVETLVVYEEEFGRDLLKDMFGKLEVDVDDLLDYEDAEAEGAEAEDAEEPGGGKLNLDFTQTNWTAMTRVLWASLKTADPAGIPPYRAWASSAGAFNMQEVITVLTPAAIQQFFR